MRRVLDRRVGPLHDLVGLINGVKSDPFPIRLGLPWNVPALHDLLISSRDLMNTVMVLVGKKSANYG